MSEPEARAIWWRLPYTATGWLMAANVAVFAWMLYAHGMGATDDHIVLFAYGAKYNPAIDRGEWYRLVSSNFLHSGWLHLVVNMYALANMGLVCEFLFGSTWFLTLYVGAGLAGAYVGYRGHDMLSVGASGAICGLGGALVALGYVGREVVRPELGDQLRRGAVPFVLGNAAVGAVIGNIDNHAHGGGFAGGFVIGALIVLLARKPQVLRTAGIAGALCALGTIGWGAYEGLVHLQEGLVAVEIVEFHRQATVPLQNALNALAKRLDALPAGERERGMARREAWLDWLDARAAFRATVLAWPEPRDPTLRVALADVRKQEPSFEALRERLARFADRTVDRDIDADDTAHHAEWEAAARTPTIKLVQELSVRLDQVYPHPKKR